MCRKCKEGRGNRSLIVGLLVSLIVGMTGTVHGQYIRSCGMASPLSSHAIAAGPAPGAGEWEVVPSLCVSERYDSNVFYAAPQPGLTRNDFVTNVSPNLLVSHNGEYVSGSLNAGGFYEAYVNNSGINFFGTNDNLSLNLDNSIKRLFPNASLQITDVVRYAPLPPGFSQVAAGTSPGAPVNSQNVYAQGFLTTRTNNVTNTATVSTSYATTASTSLNASYSYAILRWGSSPLPSTSQTGLFNSTIQTGTVGGQARLSGLDTLNVRFSHMQSEFTPTSDSTSSSFFKTDTATLGWSRILTPNLVAEVGGGGIVINPGLTTYAVNAAVVMKFQTNSATISYSRAAFPSLGTAAQPIVANVFSLAAVQKLAQQWQIAETANYAHGSGSGAGGLTYDTYFATVDIYYWVTPIWSTALSYDYMNYNTESGATTTAWSRQAITFSIRATWD